MKARRRYENAPQEHAKLSRIRSDHPALTEGRSLYQASVISATYAPRILVDGINQRKIGNRVTKGPWKGMRIFTLTLEERKTCPASCFRWETCYGNNMPFARRVNIDNEYLDRLEDELRALNAKGRGFVVRLHVLGDFYSVGYVHQWEYWLDIFPKLHVFGYTAWSAGTPIGDAVRELSTLRWENVSPSALRRRKPPR